MAPPCGCSPSVVWMAGGGLRCGDHWMAIDRFRLEVERTVSAERAATVDPRSEGCALISVMLSAVR
jgi:hypothetical protein